MILMPEFLRRLFRTRSSRAESPATEPIFAMIQGRPIIIACLQCKPCGNEFFINASSPEFLPSYCPYCGYKYEYNVDIKENDQ